MTSGDRLECQVTGVSAGIRVSFFKEQYKESYSTRRAWKEFQESPSFCP